MCGRLGLVTSFGYWQNLAMSNGTFFCMICFDVFPVGEAYEDDKGQKWDICKLCHDLEESLKDKS